MNEEEEEDGKEKELELEKSEENGKSREQKIGTLNIEKAKEIAKKLCGYDFVELSIPTKTEDDEGENRFEKKLCMICMENLKNSKFRKHMIQKHKKELGEDWKSVMKIIKRFSDVRFTRFCVNNVISETMINQQFKLINKKQMINYFSSLGFCVELENFDELDAPKKMEKRFAKQRVDEDNDDEEEEGGGGGKESSIFYEESTIRGVEVEKADEIVKKYWDDSTTTTTIVFLHELKFLRAVVPNDRMLAMSTQCSVYCHICKRAMKTKNVKRHVMTSHMEWWQNVASKTIETLEDVVEILKRMAQIRNAIYYSSCLVNYSKIEEICDFNEKNIENMLTILLNAGFVIDKENRAVESSITKLMIPYSQEKSEENEEAEEAEMSWPSTPTSHQMDRSRSSSVASSTTSNDSSASSSTSSISSLLSSSRITLKNWDSPSSDQFPYCVLNAIPTHLNVEKALYSILEKMTENLEYCLTQFEYNFLLGFTMYSLVVANGSKSNVFPRLTMGDYRSAKVDMVTELHYFRYSTKSTFSKEYHDEYLCADARIWRAMEMYECARERRVRECGMLTTLMTNESAFFVTFSTLSTMIKDTNYPMSQFLRMCGIVWSCRVSAICSEAWSLIYRDYSKISSLQYCITYFEMLRRKEQEQIDKLENGNVMDHPTMRKIEEIRIGQKERKNKLRIDEEEEEEDEKKTMKTKAKKKRKK